MPIIPQNFKIMDFALEAPVDASTGNPGAQQAVAPAAAAFAQQQIATSSDVAVNASAGGNLSTEQPASGSAGDVQQLADTSGLVEGQNMNLM